MAAIGKPHGNSGGGGSRKPNRQQRKAARLIASGAPYKTALIAAGYSPAQARKGVERIVRSKALKEALRQEMERFPPDVRADLVRVRLLQNLINGEDRAVRSAK